MGNINTKYIENTMSESLHELNKATMIARTLEIKCSDQSDSELVKAIITIHEELRNSCEKINQYIANNKGEE